MRDSVFILTVLLLLLALPFVGADDSFTCVTVDGGMLTTNDLSKCVRESVKPCTGPVLSFFLLFVI